jgi:hypothetical protein
VLRVNREGHERYHDNHHRLPVDVPNGGEVHTVAQYGIEFADEDASNEAYDTIQEARQAYQDYLDAAEDEPEEYEGMRIMVRSITTVTEAWKPFEVVKS